MNTKPTLSRQDFVDQLIPHKTPVQNGKGHANVNIALSKYWGKREIELNLPTNSSLSIDLPGLGTQTKIIPLMLSNENHDQIFLNGIQLQQDDKFASRLTQFLNLFRHSPSQAFEIHTHNSVPTSAGLASSASGYAALVLALNDCFQWQLPTQSLSLLARIGSGSACRSIFNGFVVWHKGQREDGMDSFAEPLSAVWQELCIGLLEIDTQAKKTGSTQGMQQTVNQCELYSAWPKKAENDVINIQQAIIDQDFARLGSLAENNALSMHATMIATWPPILYWQPESVAAMHQVWQMREAGVEIYFTMDAGPNLKLLFQEKDQAVIQQNFSKVKIIKPFQ